MERFEKLSDQEKLDIAVVIAKENLETVNDKLNDVAFEETFYTKYGKRLLDIVLSLPAVILTLPINCFLAIATWIDVGRPLIFYQRRIGKDLKFFQFGKFRNMKEERDENGILLLAEDRVTEWGKFVRKTSLDELLNFWYVLKGDMSVIGPRPMPDEYLGRFNKRHIKRHLVKPGLECPLHSKSYQGLMNWENRFDNDVWYVENISFSTDIKMFFLLFYDTFFAKRRKYRGLALSGTFMGYEKDGSVIVSNNIPQKYYDILLEREK